MKINQSILILIVLFLCSSCTMQAKDLMISDLQIIRNSDKIHIALDEPVEKVLEKIGSKYSGSDILKNGSENSPWDTKQFTFDGLTVSSLRGFPSVYLVAITTATYSTSDGIKVGDSIKKIEKIYKSINKYEGFYIVSLKDDDEEKGFIFEFNSQGYITKITMNVFIQ